MKKESTTVLIIVIACLMMCLAGCSRNGFGCHGRSKDMTGTSHRFNK